MVITDIKPATGSVAVLPQAQNKGLHLSAIPRREIVVQSHELLSGSPISLVRSKLR